MDIDLIFKIAAVGIIVSILNQVLVRSGREEQATMTSLAALVVVLFGQFVVSIDMTVLNIALPDLTAELQPTSDQQLWIIDVYSLVLAGLLVTASSLSDRWGRKRMMLAGFAVFGIGSGLIMFADTTEAVIALRALLGVGAAR